LTLGGRELGAVQKGGRSVGVFPSVKWICDGHLRWVVVVSIGLGFGGQGSSERVWVVALVFVPRVGWGVGVRGLMVVGGFGYGTSKE